MFPSSPPSGPSLDAVIQIPAYQSGLKGAWTIPPIFGRIAAGAGGSAKQGSAAQKEGLELIQNDSAMHKLMFNTYNMGIGFVLALKHGDARRASEILDGAGYPSWIIGKVETGSGVCRFA
jgi:phosphoribosylformylglycinamidine cyclo-ligase